MINYELAKELKEGGWPHVCGPICPADKNFETHPTKWPTLEELIEACGLFFYSLVQDTDFHWVSFSTVDGQNTLAKVTGATPTEAVAKLWLALNKHD